MKILIEESGIVLRNIKTDERVYVRLFGFTELKENKPEEDLKL